MTVRKQLWIAGAFAAVTVCSPASAQKMIGQVRTLPIVISKSGSYKLRSNIVVPDANTTAISVQADNVTIDLNGFSILGPTVCSGGPPVTSCTPTGTGNGIDGGSSTNIAVLNGAVRGMGRSGVVLYGRWARVEKVHSISNGSCGIEAGYSSTILGNAASYNGDSGIRGNWESSVISGNVADGNVGDGIEGGTTVTNNTAMRNGCAGLAVGGPATVIGNSSAFNGCQGLNILGGEVAYTNNVFQINAAGSISGGGTDMGHNDCNGSTTCP